MSTDAGTAALVALRARAQHLHEALDALEAGRGPASGAAALRSAAERLAGLLGSLREVLDPERTDPVRDHLRALAGEAAAVSDAAAHGELLAGLLGDVPRALVVGPVGDRLRHQARERRDHAADALGKAVRDEDCVATVRAVDRLVIVPPLTEAAGGKAAKILARAAAEDDRRLAEARDALRGASTAAEREERRQEVRTAAVTLAGTAAAAVDEHGKKARRLAGSADEVAAAVDDVDHLTAARRLLVDLADQAHRRREPGFTYGLLHAAATTRASTARAALDEALDETAEDKRRSWLAGR